MNKTTKVLLVVCLLLLLNAQTAISETQAQWDYKHKAYYGAYSKAMFQAYYGPNAVPSMSAWDICSEEARKDILAAQKKKQSSQTSNNKRNYNNR